VDRRQRKIFVMRFTLFSFFGLRFPGPRLRLKGNKKSRSTHTRIDAMNNVQTINTLFTQTAHACHVEQLPVTLLFGNDSATYLGGQKVETSLQYPSRAQFLRRQQIAAMVERQTTPATIGDFEALTQV